MAAHWLGPPAPPHTLPCLPKRAVAPPQPRAKVRATEVTEVTIEVTIEVTEVTTEKPK